MTEGWTDTHTDRQAEGQTDRQTELSTDGLGLLHVVGLRAKKDHPDRSLSQKRCMSRIWTAFGGGRAPPIRNQAERRPNTRQPIRVLSVQLSEWHHNSMRSDWLARFHLPVLSPLATMIKQLTWGMHELYSIQKALEEWKDQLSTWYAQELDLNTKVKARLDYA